jgi:hypothetical protein
MEDVMTTLIEYPIYQKITPDVFGSEFHCLATVDRCARMFFIGATPDAAKKKAEDWINKNFDTPERRARIANLAAKRVAAKKQKQRGVV